nr:hypothetical protein [uncultured Draconibacterium sp.]
MITFEYGAMSSKYQIEAENKLTAYVAMIAHYGQNNHLIAVYEPKEIIKDDGWMNPLGAVSK